MLVVFEDVHWSDQASLEVVQQLARSARSTPLLLVLTYRADEVNPDLRQTLAALDRERLAVEVRLGGLDASQVGAMLRATLGLDRPVRSDLVELVAGLTDGNPFFIEEVLRSQRAAGDLALVNGQWSWSAEGRVHVPQNGPRRGPAADAAARRHGPPRVELRCRRWADSSTSSSSSSSAAAARMRCWSH